MKDGLERNPDPAAPSIAYIQESVKGGTESPPGVLLTEEVRNVATSAYPQVFRYCLRSLRDEDLAAEAAEKAYFVLENKVARLSFGTADMVGRYLFSVARRVCWDVRKKHRAQARRESFLEDLAPGSVTTRDALTCGSVSCSETPLALTPEDVLLIRESEPEKQEILRSGLAQINPRDLATIARLSRIKKSRQQRGQLHRARRRAEAILRELGIRKGPRGTLVLDDPPATG